MAVFDYLSFFIYLQDTDDFDYTVSTVPWYPKLPCKL
jgi:hypothetical protein